MQWMPIETITTDLGPVLLVERAPPGPSIPFKIGVPIECMRSGESAIYVSGEPMIVGDPEHFEAQRAAIRERFSLWCEIPLLPPES